MGEHTGCLHTMLHIGMKREKVNQLSRCFKILHEYSHCGDLILDNYYSYKMAEENIFEREKRVSS